MEVAVTSDVGTGQRHNDDGWCAEQLHKNVTLLAVADGFGRPQGVSASTVVLDAIRDRVRRELRRATLPSRTLTRNDLRELLVHAFADANDRLLRMSGGGDDYVSSGCTCSLILIVSEEAFVAHIGDSRAYLLRRGELVQLTSDEAIETDFVRSGSGQAAARPTRHALPLLTRALGIEPAANAPPKVTHYTLHPHDALLLCTDGACRGLSHGDIQTYLASTDRADTIAERIVGRSRAWGNTDNATVLFVRDANEHGTPRETLAIHRRSRRTLAAMFVVLGIFWVAMLFGVGLRAADDHLYLGVDQTGTVTLYAGLPTAIGGLPLHYVRGRYGTQVSTLPAAARRELETGMPVDSVGEASTLVDQWREQQSKP
jgi:serine/threonine protein phosphatase PrpC